MRDDFDLPRILAETFIAEAEHDAALSSTNDRAREIAAETNRPLPLLIVADAQTAGRGRGANRWWTGKGSLAFSVLIDPAALGIDRRCCGLISLTSAVALVETLAPLLPGQVVGLHWPNDVYAASRKLAGILVEALPDGRHIIGIGLNVNNSLCEAPPELQSIATSLFDLTAQPHSRDRVLRLLLCRLEGSLGQLAIAPAAMGECFHSMCLQLGQTLTIEHGQELVRGCCEGIAADGGLLLATASGRRKFYAGIVRRNS